MFLVIKTLMNKPYSAACDRNKAPILDVLKKFITKDDRNLLEVGSGTGQHAVYMAPFFPLLNWYPTDVKENLPGMQLWFDEYQVSNIQAPLILKVGVDQFPAMDIDVIYTANTFHIMSWQECLILMDMMSRKLRKGGRVLIYGPFKYNDQFTSSSNEAFDLQLKQRQPLSGIRSFEHINQFMKEHGLVLRCDQSMPANNQLLVFARE